MDRQEVLTSDTSLKVIHKKDYQVVRTQLFCTNSVFLEVSNVYRILFLTLQMTFFHQLVV